MTKTLKKYLGSIYVEPVLNREIVHAVLTERQTSDCDVKCRITKYILVSVEISCIWASNKWKTCTMILFK